MQRLKDKELKRKHLLKRRVKDSDSDKKKKKIPKNIRTRKSLRFQVSGTERIKFCKTTPLTTELKRIIGRRIFNIIPPEMKQPGCVPLISVFWDKDNNSIVLRADLMEHEDFITHDENGNAVLIPDTEFKK